MLFYKWNLYGRTYVRVAASSYTFFFFLDKYADGRHKSYLLKDFNIPSCRVNITKWIRI